VADISIRQSHQLSLRSAQAAAQKIADRLAAEYDMSTSWKGNVLNFKRAGVSGTLVLHENQAQVDVTLGFLFKAFSAKFEEKIARQMKQVFTDNA
jgi:putative polyhydroxyalkanoate system protein